jgi:hypothetical protein
MDYLPNEVLNHIFSYRERNPTAKLIKDAYKNYTDKDIDGDDIVFHCFFLDYCMCHKIQRNKKQVNVLWSKPNNNEEL